MGRQRSVNLTIELIRKHQMCMCTPLYNIQPENVVCYNLCKSLCKENEISSFVKLVKRCSGLLVGCFSAVKRAHLQAMDILSLYTPLLRVVFPFAPKKLNESNITIQLNKLHHLKCHSCHLCEMKKDNVNTKVESLKGKLLQK